MTQSKSHASALWLLAAAMAASCTQGSDPEPSSPEISVGFRVHASTAANGQDRDSEDERYLVGEDLENQIDVENGDYAIYFFDDNDRYICRFAPTHVTVTPIDGSHYVDYTVSGRVSSQLTLHSSFKIVVLANRGYSYPAGNLGMTIDDLNHGDGATFSVSDLVCDGNITKIPMFGVRAYSGVEYTSAEADPTVVYAVNGNNSNNFGPVTMLRSIAKVMVEFDSGIEEDFSVTGLTVKNVNPSGYCGPEGINDRGDYDHDGSYDNDYWSGRLHLPGGKNSDSPINIGLTETDKDKVWVAYIPEYRNIGASNSDCLLSSSAPDINPTPSYISLSLNRGGVMTTHRIEFAAHDSDGEPILSQRYNIERNNLYHFVIKKIDSGLWLTIEAEPWHGVNHEEIKL